MDLGENMEQLRSAVKSSSVNKASIVVDASRYIQELKGRVEKLTQELESTSTHHNSSLPAMVKIESVERGFQINVYSEKNCPGLLESILEAFENLGLEVLEFRVSSSHNFQLEALSENEGQCSESIDAQVVRGAVVQAIRSWGQNNSD